MVPVHCACNQGKNTVLAGPDIPTWPRTGGELHHRNRVDLSMEIMARKKALKSSAFTSAELSVTLLLFLRLFRYLPNFFGMSLALFQPPLQFAKPGLARHAGGGPGGGAHRGFAATPLPLPHRSETSVS